jgi:hypothetical protein
MSVKLDIKGIEELNKELNKIQKKIAPNVYKTIIEVMKVEVETKAKKEVPVDTGRLKNSIYVATKGMKYNYRDDLGNSYDGTAKDVKLDTYDVAVGSNVNYAEKMDKLGGGGPNSGRSVKGKKRSKGYGRGFLTDNFNKAIPILMNKIKEVMLK